MQNQEEGRFKLVIQQHFRFFKNHLKIQVKDLLVLAANCKALDETEVDEINSSHITLKMNTFLKKLLRKGEIACKLMIERLQEGDWIPAEWILNEQAAVEVSPTGIQKNTLEELKTHICDEMDLSRGVVDMLFQNRTITIDDLDDIDRTIDRMAKRKTLMEILLSRNDSNWIPNFINILKETDHDTLIDDLINGRNGQTGTGTDSNRQHSRPRTLAIHLQGQAHDTENFRGILRDRPSIESALRKMIDGEVLDLREGSVVILILTTNPNQIISVLNGSDEMKTLGFLYSLFGSSKNLVQYFGNECKIKLWVEEEEYSTKDGTLHYADCPGCYRTTVIDNYNVIFAEIEDDIMNETIKTMQKGTYEEERIERITKIRSRTKKASEFLQLILDNANALLLFKTAFENRSQIEIKHSKCRKCTAKPDDMERICELEVNLTADIKGKVIVTPLPKKSECIPLTQIHQSGVTNC